ncbi:MAG: hypothetical protein K2K46_08440 [Lachnospiraceae bacterium]|nr:hypothetical protein [Lachnospiraceae bacterium]
MKKRIIKICVSILVFLLVAIGIVIGGLVFAFSYKANKIPDDDISKAIYKAVGRKKVRYWSKKSYDSGEKVIYGYVVCDYEDENLLANMVEAANAVMEEKEMTEKKVLYLWEEIPGGYSSLVSLHNYYEGEDGYEQYGTFQNLYIYGTFYDVEQHDNPYNKISTYINLPDIKSLGVTEKIAQSAEEEGIDWYEIWPDLEHYKVWED